MPRFRKCSLLMAAAMLLGWGLTSPGGGGEGAPPGEAQTAPDAPQAGVVRVSVAEARRQAEILHTTVHASLQFVHHRLYREDEGLPLPAAVMREVFAELEAEQPVKLRWLVVEGQAMNADHVANDQFERDAVAALIKGAPAYEQVADGVYRRAGPITLGNVCLKCHVPDRKTTDDRMAGLVVAIPVDSGPSAAPH